MTKEEYANLKKEFSSIETLLSESGYSKNEIVEIINWYTCPTTNN
jgi:hypothetical protein